MNPAKPILLAQIKNAQHFTFLVEKPDEYLKVLQQSGYDSKVVDKIGRMGTSILLQEIRTEGVKNALKGNSNVELIKDYRGVDVLSAYSPLHIEDVNWAIISEKMVRKRLPKFKP
ncbi:MAG: hypothetical protein H6629_03270 [Calditrichae bacterium]|nr:hypothetical protein [Calditrichia bacterium]